MKFDMGDRSAYIKTTQPEAPQPINTNITQFTMDIRKILSDTDDLVVRPFTVGQVEVVAVMFEGMVSNIQVTDLLFRQLASITENIKTGEELQQYLLEKMLPATDQKVSYTYQEVVNFAMNGFVVVMIDGCASVIAYGYQGFNSRSIGEPTTEKNLKGSKEAFCEVVTSNVALVRRRIKSPDLVVEGMTVGSTSNTRIKIIYMKGVVSEKLVEQIKTNLEKAQLSVVLDSGYLRPFIEDKKFSMFSGTGETERPDTFCAKISEGRVGILIDGTPFAIIAPYLFVEHFQTADDYLQRPYFAVFVRGLKLLCFMATLFLPGYYVAMVTYHYQLIPQLLLNSVVQSALFTPLPPVGEAILIFILYELLREAGLRLPSPIGHAISVVGGLVIGDAAVTAGLVGLPMMILIAVTAISAFVIPSLYEAVTVMRFAFIIIGGLFGLFGIYLAVTLFVVNLASVKTMGVPITAPVTPFDINGMGDVIVRSSWRNLGKRTLEVDKLPGSDYD